MNDLMSVVDWSRAQFALTAMVHWLFVPLTIGLSFIVALMETMYFRTKLEKWKKLTKFWMLLFGINFACGVATGIILEFEFGTNWSNYSWFVGDIFGAPLAIEGIFAFFMESTFIAVMFFGWNKVSRGFHLAATWLTAFGVVLSALWILVANAWMQYPAGMEFDPDQMRNVMVNFSDVVFSPVAMNKFFHTVFSGWTLGGVFVVGVACFMLFRKSNREAALMSIKLGGWVGLIGLLLTMYTGDGSAVQVSRYQPMKLAAMEGLYNGQVGQGLIGIGVLNPSKTVDNQEDPMLFSVEIPYGLSVLANHDAKSFVPGINDLLDGYTIVDGNGDTVTDLSYTEKIARGKEAQEALARYHDATAAGDEQTRAEALQVLRDNYRYFGYGYFTEPSQGVPPVALTFYSFRIMVMGGGYLLLFFLAALFCAYKKQNWLDRRWIHWVGILTIPVVWIVSEAGWVVAEVGRQPWVIQDLMPARAAISAIQSSSVQITFWMFVVIFLGLLIADVSILCREISKASKKEILK
ncbi:MAG: cytochrome ubiquinol oxidase subunit I [Muribaculaceae bacterium]|nr:cytochrome ubiquinol oxidase subunit I [Muribaculaceae bacterium]